MGIVPKRNQVEGERGLEIFSNFVGNYQAAYEHKAQRNQVGKDNGIPIFYLVLWAIENANGHNDEKKSSRRFS
jgi:hypothetical protein